MSRRSSLVLRLVVVPALVAVGLAVVLNLAGGFYARLGALVALFVAAADAATFARGLWQNALVSLAAILFGLAVIEGVAQTVLPHQLFQHGNGFTGDRQDIGWGPTRPGTYPVERSAGGKLIYKATVTIDPDLLRHVASDPHGPLIAFFGDSFTFGDGVDDDATLPQHFADLAPHLHVLDLAFLAYSPAQMLRELQVGLFDRELAGARLFVIETGPLHAERVACKPSFVLRAPHYVTRPDGTLAYAGPCTSGLWRHVREFVADTAIERVFVSPVTRRTTHADIVDYLNVMSAIARLSRDKYHVPLVVIYIPAIEHMLDGTRFTDDEIEDRLKADGIHLLTNEVDETQPVRIPDDGHYTSLGNRLIAQKLDDDLKTTMPNMLAAGDGGATKTDGPQTKEASPRQGTLR